MVEIPGIRRNKNEVRQAKRTSEKKFVITSFFFRFLLEMYLWSLVIDANIFLHFSIYCLSIFVCGDDKIVYVITIVNKSIKCDVTSCILIQS